MSDDKRLEEKKKAEDFAPNEDTCPIDKTKVENLENLVPNYAKLRDEIWFETQAKLRAILDK